MRNIYYYIGKLIRFIHHYITPLFFLYVLLFCDNIYFILFILILLYLTIIGWYVIDDCILILIEDYLCGEKKMYIDDHFYMNFLNTQLKMYPYKFKSAAIYINIIIFLLFIIKVLFMYNKLKNINDEKDNTKNNLSNDFNF